MMNYKRMSRCLLTGLLFALSANVCAQTKKVMTVSVSDDGRATMQVFFPENATGRAIVGCPGGGYSHLSMQNEGTYWASFFNELGITYGDA